MKLAQRAQVRFRVNSTIPSPQRMQHQRCNLLAMSGRGNKVQERLVKNIFTYHNKPYVDYLTYSGFLGPMPVL